MLVFIFFFSIFVVCLFVLLQFALHWISSVSVHLTSTKWFLYTTNEKPNFQMKVHLGRWKYSNRGNSIVIDELTFFFFFYTNLRRWNNKISMNSNLHSLVFFIHTYFFFKSKIYSNIVQLDTFQNCLYFKPHYRDVDCFSLVVSSFVFFFHFFLFWFWPRCHSRIH